MAMRLYGHGDLFYVRNMKMWTSVYMTSDVCLCGYMRLNDYMDIRPYEYMTMIIYDNVDI